MVMFCMLQGGRRRNQFSTDDVCKETVQASVDEADDNIFFFLRAGNRWGFAGRCNLKKW